MFGVVAPPLNASVRRRMKSSVLEYVVYLLGVVMLGLFYGPAKSALGSGVTFVAAVVTYLVALRILGRSVARLVERRENG